jgi:type II secretory pathway component GspD/PulD (secretin)
MKTVSCLLMLPLLAVVASAAPNVSAPVAGLPDMTPWDPVLFGVSAQVYPALAQNNAVESTPPPLGVLATSESSSSPAPSASPSPSPSVAPAPSPSPAARRGAVPSAPAPLSSSGLAAPVRAFAPSGNGILLNFQGAPLSDVLNYLSEAAGFVIVQEAPVAGTVNVISRQPITPEEAVDLVNAVLVEKGYIAIRNGRILKIVSRRDAPKLDLPVLSGSDPARIPRKDEVVTQILPLRYGDPAKLVENLRPLLNDAATISSNEGSNAIILTDTQTNIRRIAQIIHALDTSISSIATIQVFELKFADAKSLAGIVTELFSPETSNRTGGGQQQGAGNRNRGQGGFNMGSGRGGQGGGGGGQPQQQGQSDALQAAARLVAVADEQTNSLIVSGPEEIMANVAQVVERVDRNTTEVSETRVFKLINADALETADLITNLYGDQSSVQNLFGQGNQGNRRGGQGNTPGMPPQMAAMAAMAAGGGRSERELAQARVVAVGDPRTNSVLVTASHDSMAGIAQTIGRLDASSAKKQRVYVYPLQHADPVSVAAVLRGMTGDTTANSAVNTTNRLTARSATGASADATQSSTTGTARAGQ